MTKETLSAMTPWVCVRESTVHAAVWIRTLAGPIDGSYNAPDPGRVRGPGPGDRVGAARRNVDRMIRMRATWLGVNAALGVVILRLWNMLLLKEHLDRPMVVGLWLLGAFVLFLVARETAIATPADERTRLHRGYAAVRGGPELSLVLLLLALIFLFHWGFQRAASDGREYFVQVRSLVMDWDLDLANENAVFGVRGTAGNYPFGTPLLWAPFFVLAHGWLALLNLLGGEYPANGFFNPYQRAAGLGSLLYGFAALVLIYRLLCGYFSRRLAAATAIALTTGSFIVWYLIVDNSMSHGASMFSVTLFLYVWHENRGSSARRWALLGATAGLMSLVRWQNVLFVVIPAIEEAAAWLDRALHRRKTDGADRDGSWFRRTTAGYAAFIGAFLVVFSPQFFAWSAIRGAWLAPPAGAHGTEFAAPAIGGVMFSPDRGLFSWTPLLLLAVVGLLVFARHQPRLAALFSVALALQIYINATVEWSGHGFGARRFSNCALIFAVGLAALLHWMRRRPTVAPALLVGGLVAVNVFFMTGMFAGDVPATGSVRFREMVGAGTRRVGNPFALPMSALTALRFGTDLGFYERIGAQTFNNLSIDVGGANDGRFLLNGFSGRESAGAATFRWSEGPESMLIVPLKESSDYLLEFRGVPVMHPGSDPQIVAVWVNDQLVDRIAVLPASDDHRVSIPARLSRPGFNEIRFRYAWTYSPATGGASSDTRELAVQFETIALRRIG